MYPEKPTNQSIKRACGKPKSDADGKPARNKPDYIPNDPLLTAAEAATERGQALSTFWRDVRDGRVPAAYYPSPRCPRWRKSHILAALEATRTVPTSLATANH